MSNIDLSKATETLSHLLGKAERNLPAVPAHYTSVLAAIFANTKADPTGLALADTTQTKQVEGSTEKELIYVTRQELLQRAAAAARVLSTQLGDAKNVGIIMPQSIGAVVINVAIKMLNKVPVNLPFRSTTAIVNHCINKAKITHVLVEPLLLEKFKIEPAATLITGQDIAASVTDEVRLWVREALTAAPTELPKYFPGLLAKPNDTATILWTTGSTGLPKGAVRSERSIIASVMQIQSHYDLGQEKILGTAPFDHVLGNVATMWAPLVIDAHKDAAGKQRTIVVVYHPNALDARTVKSLLVSEKITIVVTTPSMMRLYIHKAEKATFASVGHIMLGAEKLTPEARQAIHSVTGVLPEQVFGATEFGPFAAGEANVDVEIGGKVVRGNHEGTCGLPAPATAFAIISMETGELLPRGKDNPGLIFGFGPQMMDGYLDEPEKTAAVIINGWYYFGDYGYLDDDGRLVILFRVARFAKPGGEMVPMDTVEESIREITGVAETKIHVTCVPDDKRGERLVVLYVELNKTPAEVTAKLAETYPALWIPSDKDFAQLEGDSLPLGPTGKVNLLSLKQIAVEKFASK